MEGKFLASLLSFLSLFVAIYAQSVVNDIDDDSTEFELETAIYYGDSNVNLGEPFSITCIIPITDPIKWIKDGEPITRHNLRHGRDEHSFILSESAIEGEKHKIEAHISVRHALKVHEGKYQCNTLHTSYHMLHIRSPPATQKPHTKSPFIITAEEPQLSTETIYQNVHDLTPSSMDDIFTRTWSGKETMIPAKKPLPTEQTTTLTLPHHRQHHQHNHYQEGDKEDEEQQQLLKLQHQLQLEYQQYSKQQTKDNNNDQHKKFVYINATNFDGSPRATYTAASDTIGHSGVINNSGGSGSNENVGLLEIAYIPATPKSNELSTMPWHVAGEEDRLVKQPARAPQFPPPKFPPPRTTTQMQHLQPTAIENMQPHQYEHLPNQYVDKHFHTNTATSNNNKNNAAVLDIIGQPARFPLQTIQPITTTTTTNSNNQHHHEQTLLHHHHQQQHTNTQPPPMLTTHYHTLMYPTQSAGTNTLQNNYNGGKQHQLQSYSTYRHQQQQHGQQQQPPPPRQFIPAPPPITAIVSTVPNANVAYNTASTIKPFVPIATTIAWTTTSLPPPVVGKDLITPNYDHVERQLKAYEIRSPLVLSCKVASGDYKLLWLKDGVPVSKVKLLEGRHRIIPAENKFIIDRTDIHDDGVYTCVAGEHKKDINVVSHVIVRTPSNSGVVEGEKLSIVCTVVGTKPVLSWVVGNTTYTNTTDRYILKPDEKGIENAIFSIENISLEDRGEYTCVGQNDANIYANLPIKSDVSYVRVKGKLAALWPFLGICAEVLILCLIILIYEKRRNKSELEESDTDPQDQKKKRKNFN